MSGLCGVVGRGNCFEDLFFGTDYHSHLGSQLAGLALNGDGFRKKIHDISQGQFKSKFGGYLNEMSGPAGIGVISDRDAQPLLIHSRFGTYALAFAGLIENADAIAGRLFDRGSVFTETSHSGINAAELLAKVIETGSDLYDGLDRVYRLIQGSASVLLLTADGIIAGRDRLGRTGLFLGGREDGYMLASETHALTNLGYTLVRSLGPGEVVSVRPDGWQVVRGPETEMQICAFLWVYTGNPAAAYEGICVEEVRERCGGCLARRDTVEADLVAGVPDSGVGHAVGYAMHSKLPYRRVLIKYTPGYGRSYIPPSQTVRDHVARMKLLPVPETVRGKRVVLCEDSIVRGTQLKNFAIRKLRDAGAAEIHMRPACPPLMFPCRFMLSTRDKDELIARRAIRFLEGDQEAHLDEYIDETSERHRRMVQWIGEYIGVDSLSYQRLDDLIGAIGLPREKLCLYCWTGQSREYAADPGTDLDLL